MLRIINIIALSVILTGCAGGMFRIPASDQTAHAVQTTQIIIYLEQDEVIPTYTRANGSVSGGLSGSYGILGAIIGGAVEGTMEQSRAENAQKLVLPIRTSLSGYDFRNKFRDTLSLKLGTVNWLKMSKIKFDSPSKELDELRKGMQESAYLLVNTRYSLSTDFRHFRIWCSVPLLPNDNQLKNISLKERPDSQFPYLYRNEFIYIDSLPIGVVGPEAAAAMWSENNGARIRKSIDDGIVVMATMIAQDLNVVGTSSPVVAGQGASQKLYKYGEGTARVISESDGRAILRLGNGTIHSITKDQLALLKEVM